MGVLCYYFPFMWNVFHVYNVKVKDWVKAWRKMESQWMYQTYFGVYICMYTTLPVSISQALFSLFVQIRKRQMMWWRHQSMVMISGTWRRENGRGWDHERVNRNAVSESGSGRKKGKGGKNGFFFCFISCTLWLVALGDFIVSLNY